MSETEMDEKTREITYEDFIDRKKVILNFDHTIALAQRLKKEPTSPPLQKFELTDSWDAKKHTLERKVLEFATILQVRHKYTVDDEKLSNTIWHLRKAGFLSGKLTVYYFTTIQPVIISSDGGYLVIAPIHEE